MPLPALIEIVPLTAPVRAEITVPGSKSITNRALILAALAPGATTLRGALWSEDTQVMAEALQKLGFEIKIENDPEERCNRTITVRGRGGEIPNAGTAEQPLEMFVGNAGTAARFLSVLVCLGRGVYRLSGVPRMHERPQAPLFAALRELGCRVDASHERLPAVIHANPQSAIRNPQSRRCRVSIVESSQFASALLLCARIGGWEVEVVGENAEESPYVAMTSKLIGAFPSTGGTFQIEPDASSGSYFWAVNAIWPAQAGMPGVRVARWPESDWQVDARFPRFLPLPAVISRSCDLGDSMMTAMVLSPFALRPARFTDLGRLRVQECERVVALRTELTQCGATVIEQGDTLTVYPSELHGAEIESYHDHRMAMCFAILGLKVPGMRIKNPACVNKTFPNFFQKLAAPPPAGLGAEIRDGRTGRRLEGEELFAE
jgi:3-phosphoshikimate 1-carboxyvinyltransferase